MFNKACGIWRLMHIPQRATEVPFSVHRMCMHTMGTGSTCRGCGLYLQSDHAAGSGYIPSSTKDRFRDGWRKLERHARGVHEPHIPRETEISGEYVGHAKEYKSKMVYCQSCYRIQQYGSIGPHGSISGTSTARAPPADVNRLVERVSSKSVVINVIDILDFESSIVPEFYEAFKRRGIPMISVLNKCDCLPVPVKDWKTVSRWAQHVSKSLRSNIGSDGRPEVIPISSNTEEGFDQLEDRLKLYAEQHKEIVVMGRVNSGKSSFVTRFLRYVGHKHLGCVHYKRGVGGLTRAPIPSTTKEFMSFPLPNGYTLVDTPGLPSNIRIDPYLETGRDFFDVALRRTIQPITLSVREGRALIVGAMCRVQIQSGVSATLTCYFSSNVTLHVCAGDAAEDLLARKAGVFFYPPHLNDAQSESRLSVLESPWVCHRVRVYCSPTKAKDDIVIPGLGWISAYGHGHKIIDVWLPKGVKVFRRPALLPLQIHNSPTTPLHFRRRARSLNVNLRKKRLIRDMRNRPPTEGTPSAPDSGNSG